jgi:hypothetical protein
MRLHSLPNVLISTTLATISGCAKINDYASWPLATSVDAFAIVNTQLLQGKVQLLTDRTGRVTLSAAKGPVTNCVGSLRFTGTTVGAIDLRCNDGADAALQFALLSETRGYAYGHTTAGPTSLTFGLPSAQAQAYLKVPPNRKLVEVGKDKTLELQ